MKTETPRVRWGLAKILWARGRNHAALSELHKTQAEFLAVGSIGEAAMVSLDSVSLLLDMGKSDRARELARGLVTLFGDAGMLPNALRALAYLHEQAHADRLSLNVVEHVRMFLSELPHNPLRAFVPPRDEGSRPD
jgi:hypothetical protein